LWFKKKPYLSWTQYAKKIQQREMLDFITENTLRSADNLWARGVRK